MPATASTRTTRARAPAVPEKCVMPIRYIRTKCGAVDIHKATKPDVWLVFFENMRIGIVRLREGRWYSQREGQRDELPDGQRTEIGAVERLFNEQHDQRAHESTMRVLQS